MKKAPSGGDGTSSSPERAKVVESDWRNRRNPEPPPTWRAAQEILRTQPQDRLANYPQYPSVVKMKLKKIWKNLSQAWPKWPKNEMAPAMTRHWHQVVKLRHFHHSR
jgi:hypothetical protein